MINELDVKIYERNNAPCTHVCLPVESTHETQAHYVMRLFNYLNEKYFNWALESRVDEKGKIEIYLIRPEK